MTDSADIETPKTDRPWLFQKGKPGGPGRPKKVLTPEELLERRARNDLRAAAKDFTGEALTTVLSIMRNPEVAASQRLQAAEMILSRGHGKSRSDVNVTVDYYERLSDADLIRMISGKDISDEEVSAARGALITIEHEA